MPVRDIISIDESLCDGCGDCVTACAEGAIRIIDGKARLITDVYCDGLGACLGHCPTGALTVVRREAEDFDERAVEAHLERERERTPAGLPVRGQAGGCPGSMQQSFSAPETAEDTARPLRAASTPSRLSQWPVQLHLLQPTAPFLDNRDLLVAADCVAYSIGGFHDRFLADRSLAIACPKLDSHQEIYLEKLAAMIDHGGIRSISVMVMEVPCCSGLVQLVEHAIAAATRTIPTTVRVVSIRGEVLSERPIAAA
jgi:NAD-dependent dihydropyrimidine dehydrogenase PreA subunit